MPTNFAKVWIAILIGACSVFHLWVRYTHSFLWLRSTWESGHSYGWYRKLLSFASCTYISMLVVLFPEWIVAHQGDSLVPKCLCGFAAKSPFISASFAADLYCILKRFGNCCYQNKPILNLDFCMTFSLGVLLPVTSCVGIRTDLVVHVCGGDVHKLFQLGPLI